MLYQSRRLLRKLKKIQPALSHSLWLDTEQKRVCLVVESGEKQQTLSLCKNWSNDYYLFQELVKDGYIEQLDFSHFSLTASGFYFFQNRRQYRLSAIAQFLTTSIAVPIAVSVGTTLLTIWITEILK